MGCTGVIVLCYIRGSDHASSSTPIAEGCGDEEGFYVGPVCVYIEYLHSA